MTLEVRDARWLRVDVSNQRLANYVAAGSEFVDCDFSKCTWEAGVLGATPLVTYRDCVFDQADLRQSSPLYARFEHCRFVDARLDDWRAVCAEFVDCRFTGRLVRVKFSATPTGFAAERLSKYRTHNAFKGNDFREAELIDCSIGGGIDLDANDWPLSSEYMIIRSVHERIPRIRALADAQPEAVRRDILAWCDIFSKGGFKLQKDLFVRRDELGPVEAFFRSA